MKVQIMTALLLAISASSFAAEAEPSIVERGLDHRVWKRSVQEMLPDGKVVERTSGYVELATGLHFLKEGQLVESEEKFEAFNDGIIARNGQHQVIIGPTADTAGLVDILAPDGQRFRSHVLGLAFMDTSTGHSVLIAEPQNAAAELAAPNVVLFRNAFSGPFRADIRFTYTRSGFEQDVVIRQQLPSPLEYGLNPATTRVEIWTEYVEVPQAVKQERSLKPTAVPAVPVLDPTMSDESLKFGAMRIGPGSAFLLDDPTADSTVPVGKNLIQVEGRTFLIEKIDLGDIAGSLQRLPQAAVKLQGNGNAVQARIRKPSRAAALAAIPRRERRQANIAPRPKIELAANLPKEPGLVLDYQQELNANTNDFTFRADTTYYVSGTVTLSGTNYIEGGAVIKMTNGSSGNNRLVVQGQLICKNDTYKPAFLTSWKDNTIGEVIAAGDPTNLCGVYMDFSGNTAVIDLHDLRIRHAYYAIKADLNCNVTLRNSQLGSNNTAVAFGRSNVRNVLIHDHVFAFGGSGEHIPENVTFHRLTNLRSSPSYVIKATNCMIIACTNNVLFSGGNNYSNAVDTGVFQTIGSATHYLANGSTNRDAGTTNINAELLADLKKLTTFPPIVLTTDFTNDTVLFPQAQRDTDCPDIGYHWPPLDYCWTALKIQNARLTLTCRWLNR